MTRDTVEKKKKRRPRNRKAEKKIKIPWNWKMRGRRTVCFITLKVREVATYISRPSALTRERKKKPRDRFLHHGKRSSPPSESENERFREWWMTRAGSLANCEQAKCSSGFAALGWRRSECGNQPCDPTMENRGPCDRIRYIYIYMGIRWRVWIRSIVATYQRWTCQSPVWRCSWQCSAETLLTCRISLPWVDQDAGRPITRFD